MLSLITSKRLRVEQICQRQLQQCCPAHLLALDAVADAVCELVLQLLQLLTQRIQSTLVTNLL
jgi:hypothetical protein